MGVLFIFNSPFIQERGVTFKHSFSLSQSPRALSSRQVCDTELSNVQKAAVTLETSPGEIQSLALPELLAQTF